jgi:hypothetical protein
MKAAAIKVTVVSIAEMNCSLFHPIAMLRHGYERPAETHKTHTTNKATSIGTPKITNCK